MQTVEMTRADINKQFARLEIALNSAMLPTSKGPRKASAKEFMLMNKRTDGWAFKHIDSRNYIYLLDNGQIDIPVGGMFKEGVFDTF